MAQASGACKQNSIIMVEGRKLHKGNQHRRSDKKINRRCNVSAEEKQYIRELYSQGFNVEQIKLFTGWGRTTIYRALNLNFQKRPRWTYEENQALVDGYLEIPRGQIGNILSEKLGRSPRAIYLAMHWYRKKVRSDPKKKRALKAISLALRAVRKADIFREVEI